MTQLASGDLSGMMKKTKNGKHEKTGGEKESFVHL